MNAEGGVVRILEIIAVILIVLFLVDLLGTQFLGNLVYLLVIAVILLLVHFIRRAWSGQLRAQLGYAQHHFSCSTKAAFFRALYDAFTAYLQLIQNVTTKV